MLLYVAAVLWPLLIGKFSHKYTIVNFGEKGNRNAYMILAMLPMFFMIGFRSEYMGADTLTYSRNFEYIAQTSLNEVFERSRIEHGYLVFAKFIATFITRDPKLFQIIYTGIYVFAILIFMQDMGDEWPDFLFFFGTMGLFTFMFTGVRQCLAMSFCLIAYRYAVRRKPIQFALLILLAFNFHKSAILFSVVYLLVRMDVKWYNIVLYVAFTFVVLSFLPAIQEWFNDQLEYNYEIEKTSSGLIFLVFITLIVGFSWLMYWQSGSTEEKIKPVLTLGAVCVSFWVMRLQTRVAERPSYYFLFFACAGIAYILQYVVQGKERTVMKLFVMGACLLLFVYRMMTNFRSLTPYRTF